MFDFSFSELAVIGAVALVVLGPERLPKVARSLGEWVGKAQRYVSQVKIDIQREMELADLKKLQDEARAAAASLKSQVGELQSTVTGVADELHRLGADGATAGDSASGGAAGDGAAWEGTGGWQSHAFRRRYRPGPSLDELADEIERLKRQLALPAAAPPGNRHKYGPRARINRPRIRR
jgi:sec-independent protein translocase protein TatB